MSACVPCILRKKPWSNHGSIYYHSGFPKVSHRRCIWFIKVSEQDIACRLMADGGIGLGLHSSRMHAARRLAGAQSCFTTTLPICRHRPISRDLLRDWASPCQIVFIAAYRLSNSLVYCSHRGHQILSSCKRNRCRIRSFIV